MREHAHTLSDFRVPTLSIECEPCGRRGRYKVARLMEQYGGAKLPDLLQELAQCQKEGDRAAAIAAAASGSAAATGTRSETPVAPPPFPSLLVIALC
jgi:hypothetical protein